MNSRPLRSALMLCLRMASVGLAAWLLFKSPFTAVAHQNDGAPAAVVTSQPSAVAAQNSTASSPTNEPVPAATPLSAKDQAKAVSAVRQFFSHFQSMGGGEEGSPFDYVAREVADRDKVKVVRAFNELLYRYPPTDSLPVLQSYVRDTDTYTRYVAAESLLIAGDESGVPALAALLKADQPIAGIGNKEDLRVRAALTLAKYHQTAAVPEILNVYSKTLSR